MYVRGLRLCPFCVPKRPVLRCHTARFKCQYGAFCAPAWVFGSRQTPACKKFSEAFGSCFRLPVPCGGCPFVAGGGTSCHGCLWLSLNALDAYTVIFVQKFGHLALVLCSFHFYFHRHFIFVSLRRMLFFYAVVVYSHPVFL